MFLYVLAGYLVILAALTLGRAVPVKSPLVQRLRAFFPSWRFFEDLGDVPVLYRRVGQTPDTLGAWELCLPRLRRRARAFLFNPEGNLALARDSLVQQLVADAAEHPEEADFAESVSYQLTHELVRQQVPGGSCFQWKVQSGGEDVLVSPVYPP